VPYTAIQFLYFKLFPVLNIVVLLFMTLNTRLLHSQGGTQKPFLWGNNNPLRGLNNTLRCHNLLALFLAIALVNRIILLYLKV